MPHNTIMTLITESKYNIGDAVYIKTDPDQHERLVIGILIKQYLLNSCTTESYHTNIEISSTKKV